MEIYRKFTMQLNIVFLIAVFLVSNVEAKRAPFRNFIIPSGFKASEYDFKDWEEIEGNLTTHILRGNDFQTINNNVVNAKYTLASLGKMTLNDKERATVRKYLIDFLSEYLADKRMKQLLYDKERHQDENYRTTFEPAYFDLVHMPSYILCTIARNSPSKEDIEKIWKILSEYKAGIIMPEQYLIEFLSDLFFFRTLKIAEEFLDKKDFSFLSQNGQEKIKILRVAVQAELQKDQKDTWRFLLQKHLQIIKMKDLEKEDSKNSILLQESTFEQIFITLYPDPDYQLLLKLAQRDNQDEAIFFIYQFSNLTSRGYLAKNITTCDMKVYLEYIKKFLVSKNQFEFSESRKMHEVIVQSYNWLQKELAKGRETGEMK